MLLMVSRTLEFSQTRTYLCRVGEDPEEVRQTNGGITKGIVHRKDTRTTFLQNRLDLEDDQRVRE